MVAFSWVVQLFHVQSVRSLLPYFARYVLDFLVDLCTPYLGKDTLRGTWAIGFFGRRRRSWSCLRYVEVMISERKIMENQ